MATLNESGLLAFHYKISVKGFAMRSEEAFSWSNGNTPKCLVHSKVKLEILRDYLLAYFPTLAGNPRVDCVNVHLVDAFSGGGTFRDTTSKLPVVGSPFVMLNAVRESAIAISADRIKPFKINARFHFADKSRSAIENLSKEIVAAGFGGSVGSGEIRIDCMEFDRFLPSVLQRIPSAKKTKAIFFLDQCGWNTATLDHCNAILRHLPKAEIIWNISIESLATFANDDDRFRKAIKRFGVSLDDAFTSNPNHRHESDWRKALVAIFLERIRKNCVAKFVSPFMIQHNGWGYWLLHLSNHWQANNVMKGRHWQHHNSSLHEGFAGLRMLEFDRDNWDQTSFFRFDEWAAEATHDALVEDLLPRIRTFHNSPTVSELIASVANETPADQVRLYRALNDIRSSGQIIIEGANGERRQMIPQSLDDRIVVTHQRVFSFRN